MLCAFTGIVWKSHIFLYLYIFVFFNRLLQDATQLLPSTLTQILIWIGEIITNFYPTSFASKISLQTFHLSSKLTTSLWRCNYNVVWTSTTLKQRRVLHWDIFSHFLLIPKEFNIMLFFFFSFCLFRCAKKILKKKNIDSDVIGLQYYGKKLRTIL